MRRNGEDVIRVVCAGRRQLDDLAGLVARIEAEEADRGESTSHAMAESLARYDALSSDSVWFLIAYRQGTPAGLAVLTRVPKLDRRIGFLYLDELHVLAEHRRRGLGTALLHASLDLARQSGLVGVRLLTRPDNHAAQALYESVGFRGHESILYQRRVDEAYP